MSNSGWNRSSSNQPKVTKKGGTRFSLLHGLIAGAVVVVLGFAVLAIFSGGEDAPKAKAEKDRGRIKEVTPAAAPKTEAKQEPEKPKKLPPQVFGEVRNGYRLLPNGKLHKVTSVVKSKMESRSLAAKTFEEPADRSIASLLMLVPGTTMVGESNMYYNDFNKEFKQALKTEIVIKPDDTDEVKELKQAVIDARKELKAKMDAGEDLVQIMRDAREEMRQLTLYREELNKEVEKIVLEKEDLTEKDFGELIGAANQMLDERGVKPLSLTAPMLYQVRQHALDVREHELQEKLKKAEQAAGKEETK